MIFPLSSRLIPSFLLTSPPACPMGVSNLLSHAKHRSVKWSDQHPQLVTSLCSSLTALPPAMLISVLLFKHGRKAPPLGEHVIPSFWKVLAQLASWLPPSPPPGLYQRPLITEALLDHFILSHSLLSRSLLPFLSPTSYRLVTVIILTFLFVFSSH